MSAPACLVVVGGAGERNDLLQAALARAGRPPGAVVSYRDALQSLDQLVGPGTVVRFEPADGDDHATKLFLALGADEQDPDEPRAERMTLADIARYEPAPGDIRAMRQTHLGQRRLWAELEDTVHHHGGQVMNRAAALATTFDKRATHRALDAAGVAVAPAVADVRCFEDLTGPIGDVPGRQLMIKTAHGSAATGAIALRTDGTRWLAATTAVLRDGRLWNTRRVHRLTELPRIEPLVDAVCRQVVHAEHWLPKATLADGPFDLRVVVIGGVARHVLARSARGPFTNLHLGARRADVALVRQRMGDEAWGSALSLAERAVGAIGGLRYAGVDVLVGRAPGRLAVLEVNGFGDWHPDVFVDGMDTYDWELRDLVEQPCPT